MSSMATHFTPRRFHVPREHGATLIDPPLKQCVELIADNQEQFRSRSLNVQGRDFSSLASDARTELLHQATSYTSAYRAVPEPLDTELDAPIIMSGHQPELFHPGVWAKNFAIHGLAQQHGGHAINVIVDNDICATSSIRVPTGTLESPTIASTMYDSSQRKIPYEERRICDTELFASFGKRTAATISPLVADPLINTFWTPATEASCRSNNLGQCLAEARHVYEEQIGLETLEYPLSRICDTTPFRWFACHLLANLPMLWEIYNDALSEYRQTHKLRSHSHPVPNLAMDGDYLEAPFWMWSDKSPERLPVFARYVGDAIELTDRHKLRLSLNLDSDQDAGSAVQQLKQFAQNGIRIRPRALLTTMYLRLFLCDLFVHGVGGAKYDEVTNRVLQQFFNIEPPSFLVTSATSILPIPTAQVTPAELRHNTWLLRDMTYHPEHHVEVHREEIKQQIAEKQRWISKNCLPQDRRKRHLAIERINRSLQSFLEEKRELTVQKRLKIEDSLSKNALLTSREYSFCLFPNEILCRLLLELFVKDL